MVIFIVIIIIFIINVVANFGKFISSLPTSHHNCPNNNTQLPLFSLFTLNILYAGKFSFVAIFSILLLSRPAEISAANRNIEKNAIQYQIHENIPIGTLIGNVIEDIKRLSNPIWFLASSANLQFKLSNENPYFQLNIEDGSIKTKSEIDLEKLCPKLCKFERGYINISVNIWSNFKLQGVAKISIIIIDMNDNRPYFKTDSITLDISEILYTKDKLIKLPKARDNDVALVNRQIAYQLIYRNGRNNKDFLLQVEDGVPNLKLLKIMDSETCNRYQMDLVAWNLNFSVKQSAKLAITINIIDINDNEPVFEKSQYLVPVPENTKAGSIVYQLTATDRDINSKLTYSMAPESLVSKSSEMFRVEKTGKITLLRSLDHEKQVVYLFSVKVSDGEFSAFTKLKMIIIDINDEPPIFTLTPRHVVVYENTEPKLIAQLTVSDRDSEDVNGRIQCYDPSQPMKPNEIKSIPQPQIVEFRPLSSDFSEPRFGIWLRKGLDREVHSDGAVQTATLVCYDHGLPASLTSTFTLSIHVLDHNDNWPQFSRFLDRIEVKENWPLNLPIFQFEATDIDSDGNAKIQYSIVNFTNKYSSTVFRIDPANGVLYPIIKLDREMKDFYQILVVAEDQSVTEPHQSASIMVNISIIDENDNLPQLISPTKFLVPENEPIGTPVGQLRAFDPDLASAGLVDFEFGANKNEIVNDRSNPFKLMKNGSLVTAKVLDREVQNLYSYKVIMSDNGIPIKNTATAAIEIEVTDKNDNAPVIILPSFQKVYETLNSESSQIPSSNSIQLQLSSSLASSSSSASSTIKNNDYIYQLNISIYTQSDFILEKVLVDDYDEGDNANVTLALQKLNDEVDFGTNSMNNKFTDNLELVNFDSVTRHLLAIGKLDVEKVGCYWFMFTAVDHGEIPLSTEQMVQLCFTTSPPPASTHPFKDATNSLTNLSKANLLIIIILVGVSIFLATLLVSAVLCMVQPCRQIQIRHRCRQMRRHHDAVSNLTDSQYHSTNSSFMHNGSDSNNNNCNNNNNEMNLSTRFSGLHPINESLTENLLNSLHKIDGDDDEDREELLEKIMESKFDANFPKELNCKWSFNKIAAKMKDVEYPQWSNATPLSTVNNATVLYHHTPISATVGGSNVTNLHQHPNPIGSEEQRSDSGRGASDEDNNINQYPSSLSNSADTFQHSFLPNKSKQFSLANNNFILCPLSTPQNFYSKNNPIYDDSQVSIFTNCSCCQYDATNQHQSLSDDVIPTYYTLQLHQSAQNTNTNTNTNSPTSCLYTIPTPTLANPSPSLIVHNDPQISSTMFNNYHALVTTTLPSSSSTNYNQPVIISPTAIMTTTASAKASTQSFVTLSPNSTNNQPSSSNNIISDLSSHIDHLFFTTNKRTV